MAHKYLSDAASKCLFRENIIDFSEMMHCWHINETLMTHCGGGAPHLADQY
jgi:hypothetical protein